MTMMLMMETRKYYNIYYIKKSYLAAMNKIFIYAARPCVNKMT